MGVTEAWKEYCTYNRGCCVWLLDIPASVRGSLCVHTSYTLPAGQVCVVVHLYEQPGPPITIRAAMAGGHCCAWLCSLVGTPATQNVFSCTLHTGACCQTHVQPVTVGNALPEGFCSVATAAISAVQRWLSLVAG